MNKILITGGAGFIGSRLAKRLAKSSPNARICVIDNLHPQVHGKNPVEPVATAQIDFHRQDVTDHAGLNAVVQSFQPQLVYHLAAETGTGQSYDEPVRYCDVNIQGTANLIDAIRRCESVERVVLAGSRAVYGEGAYVDSTGREFIGAPRDVTDLEAGRFDPAPPEWAVTPVKTCGSHSGIGVRPASIYASTKLMQEYLLEQAGAGAPWTATILRFQNVYGPGQSLNNPYTGVLSIFSKSLLQGATLDIFEDGNITRDFIFVDDVVESLVAASAPNLPHGAIYDIGTGKAVSITEVARMLMRALGLPDDRYKISGNFRPGDIRHANASIESARKTLGWSPSISIEEGIQRLADWAKIEYSEKGSP